MTEIEVAQPARRSLGSSYRKLFAATTLSNIGDGMSTIAYPWLASAITRNPILIACVAVGQRLPWLVFTLPAGVITDRVDRKQAMMTMNLLRFVLTAFVALAVLGQQGSLPSPDQIGTITTTRTGLYLLLLSATLLLGMAEVLHANCGRPSCRRSSTASTSSGQTAAFGAQRASPTRSSARRSGRCSWSSHSRSRSSSTPPPSSSPPRSWRRFPGRFGQSAPTTTSMPRGARSSPRASAGSGDIRCCVRWRSSSA